jgi:hypothetical protein
MASRFRCDRFSISRTRTYEAHYGLTQEWANQLLGLGYPGGLALEYDRLDGSVVHTLDQLANEPPGNAYESLHFVLNNTVIKDNRIPTWGMRYDDSRVRNTLPVPANQCGDPGPGGAYQHWDEVLLDPPSSAATTVVDLVYQPTSWEYIQFLALANDGSVTFLADEGDNMLEAWVEAGMAEPHTMVSTTLVVPEPGTLASWLSGIAFLGWAKRRRVSHNNPVRMRTPSPPT